MLTSLSVFFPCYNEIESIPKLLEGASRFLPTITKKLQIILVDDGSTDGTKELAESMVQRYPNLLYVRHEKNAGYGQALKTGIESSVHDWVFWTDGDLQFDITQLEKFVKETEKSDAIIGYRAHRADTFIRKVNGELYTRLINILFKLEVRDIDCAFKLIKRKQLENVSITTSSAFTSSEILIKLKKNGVRLSQLPVSHFPRKHGKSTGNSLSVILKGLYQTVHFFVSQY